MAAELVSVLTTAFVNTAKALGEGVRILFTDLITETSTVNGVSTTSISDLGVFVLVMAGIGFAFGLSKMFVNLIRNRG